MGIMGTRTVAERVPAKGSNTTTEKQAKQARTTRRGGALATIKEQQEIRHALDENDDPQTEHPKQPLKRSSQSLLEMVGAKIRDDQRSPRQVPI